MDKIFVSIIGLAAIIFIYWFFFGKKEEAQIASEEIDILVSGGYQPQNIVLPNKRKTVLKFLRKDESSCLEEVLIPDFNIRKFLPLNQTVSIELTPQVTGNFPFSCGMNMFHGKIMVK